MAIQQGDVKLVASVVMDDVPEGGGAPSATVIEDNQSNAIFKDISESDRARGRLNMAKVAVSVQTPDTDTFLGANFIVAKPPEDPNVSITIFTTDNVFDTRADARARLEAYLNKGAEWGGFLLENHITGQRAIQILQRPDSELPAVGKTLCLTQNEGLPNAKEQYVRVTEVSAVLRTFTYSANNSYTDYQGLVVTLGLSDPLRYDFTGTSANRSFSRNSTAAKVLDSVVADAATYAGVTPLAAPITLGDLTLKAESVFTNLVPSAQVETPIVATPPYSAAGVPARATHAVTYSTSQVWSESTSMNLPGGCTPGTLSITSGSTTIVDKAGLLMLGEQQVGTVDYANGILTRLTGTDSSAKEVRYEPAGFLQRLPQSSDTLVTAESRSQNYVGFVSPLAAPGTFSLSYMVQGRWYVLSDAGDGSLRGFDASHGAGTYNPATGDYVVTLRELPDVGSSIVRQWGVATQEFAHPVATIPLSQEITLETEASDMLDPTFMQIRWLDNGVQKVADVNTAGVVSGDGFGTLNVAESKLTFTPNTLPIFGTQLTVEYDTGPKTVTELPYPSRNSGGRLDVNAGGVNLVPGSVVVQWNTVTDLSIFDTYTSEQLLQMGITWRDPIQTARDNGNGRLLRDGIDVGSVNYTTGQIVFNPDATISLPDVNYSPQRISGFGDSAVWRLNYAGLTYRQTATVYPADESGWVKVQFYSATSATRRSKTVDFAPSFPLVLGTEAPTAAGSLVLTTNLGEPWGDNGMGVLQEPTATGVVARGGIDYATSRVTLRNWPVGVSGNVTRNSLLTTLGENVSSVYVFRTSAAPLRPGSVSIQFAKQGGGTQTVTASQGGVISAPGVTGMVDHATGLIRLGFGTDVDAAGNEDQPWYDASRVTPEGKIFKPEPIPARTVKYNAVAYSYMSLNADLVGIDPVRLPSDGRVPIFRAGSMVVIGNTKTTPPFTPTNGQTINLARTRLSRAIVRDATGKVVNSGYTSDLDAGLVTFTDVSEINAPATIEHRIEDMLVAREVQISGDMSFTRQITHDYPVEGTYVSSALEFGDRKARVNLTFDQSSWNGIEWADAATSAVAAASYNTTLSPIEVTNIGASTERWGLWFTSATQFRIVGEHVGQIGTGDINTDCAPINPATGQPYFTVRALGWGTGWANGNVLRINTVGALAPVWVVRTIQPGIESGVDYSFDLLTRGDVDRT